MVKAVDRTLKTGSYPVKQKQIFSSKRLSILDVDLEDGQFRLHEFIELPTQQQSKNENGV